MSLSRSFSHARISTSPAFFNIAITSSRCSFSTSGSSPHTSIDYKVLAKRQKLFISSPYSPGSPLFSPAGTHILNNLISCLRAHYPAFGFQEVITPSIYKASLWKKSGHWDHYSKDMFSVGTRNDSMATNELEAADAEEWGLKPMNCPGHCLLFDSEPRSHRQLPIRYADFSALHRNENTGSLTGLTRVRRFHQDDGHIFCKPSQVGTEISRTLEFIELIYKKIFNLPSYRLVLSTRPAQGYIGSIKEWNKTEDQLKAALEATGRQWTVEPGEGAFYGPKIDIILKDSNGKEHQTATIQLDKNLPARFQLKYQAANESEQAPVLIHRAVFGSLERFLALIIEHYASSYPFWLSARPLTILTVKTSDEEIAYAEDIACYWSGITRSSKGFGFQPDLSQSIAPQPILRPNLPITVDSSARTLQQKIRSAHEDGYNFICVVGARDIEKRSVSIDIAHQKQGGELWAEFSSPQKNRLTINVEEAKALWDSLRDSYL